MSLYDAAKAIVERQPEKLTKQEREILGAFKAEQRRLDLIFGHTVELSPSLAVMLLRAKA